MSSSVKTNGWLTAFITLGRGLRQGCPLSMPLYVLTAETMAVNIRSNPRIRGILPPGAETELKLSQFADDTTLLLADDESITETFHVFHRYERAAGTKINKSKCKGGFCYRQARGPAARGPRPATAQRPGSPKARSPIPHFPQFFCPAVNPRACTYLHRVWACKMDDGEFEFVYHFNHLNPCFCLLL